MSTIAITSRPTPEHCRIEENTSARITIVLDKVRPSALFSKRCLEGGDRSAFEANLFSSGINPTLVRYVSLSRMSNFPSAENYVEAAGLLNTEFIVPAGECALRFVTGKKSLDKWHCSRLLSTQGTKVMPIYSPERSMANPALNFYIRHALARVRRGLDGDWPIPKPTLILNPPAPIVREYFNDVLLKAEEVANDIETGRGQINTVGFCAKPDEALVLNVLPRNYSPERFYQTWDWIRQVLENPKTGKVFQNGPYETQYYSQYGIRVLGYAWDTMWANKFCYPEFECGLGNVGRLFTEYPYWKDVGRTVVKEEEGKRDWGNIRDWGQHYKYNGLDCVGTAAGAKAQRAHMAEQGLLEPFQDLVLSNASAAAEMYLEGLPVREEERARLSEKLLERIASHKQQLVEAAGGEVNHRSVKDKKRFLTSSPRLYKLPKVWNASDKKYKESTGKQALMQLRLANPEDQALTELLELSRLEKAHGTYVDFKYDRRRGRMGFSLNLIIKSGRWSCNQDAWDCGMNAQTVPGGNKGINIKELFFADLPGHTFFSVDLKQAESRYVAYEAPDFKMIKMLEDPEEDVHKYVGANIFGLSFPEGMKSRSYVLSEDKAEAKLRRHLGKKTGHGKNYDMKGAVFVATCLEEIGLVLPRSKGDFFLNTYDELFPGIAKRKKNIQKELWAKRCLRTPLGRVRYFYGRVNDTVFRDAYSFCPQSTVPDITNAMMRYLLRLRDEGKLKFVLHLQCHDSLLLQAPKEHIGALKAACEDTDAWHPRIDLPGGRLVIPTSCEVGDCWGSMEEI